MATRFKSGQEIMYTGVYMANGLPAGRSTKYNGDGTADVSFELHGSSLCSVHTVDQINIRLPLLGTKVGREGSSGATGQSVIKR